MELTMSASQIGLRVLISISDPWDFVTHNGESRTGTIISEDSGLGESSPSLLIRLDRGVQESGVEAETVFAAFRHAGTARKDFLSGRLVPCNFSTKRNDSGLVAGSLAFIGGLQLA
jgi:hypothetical protein